MSIKSIRVTNFKSFKELEVNLDKLNILIGANASGKSGFMSIPVFLGDIARYGLENAISIQGGVGYVRNTILGSSENLSIRIAFDYEIAVLVGRKERVPISIDVSEVIYEFSISFNKRGEGFKVVDDKFILRGNILELGNKRDEKPTVLGAGEVSVVNINGKTKGNFILPEGLQLKEQDRFPPFIGGYPLNSKSLILEYPSFFPPPLYSFFTDLSVYDFDPRLAKKAVPITGKIELEDDAANLAIVLKDIISDKYSRRQFLNLIKDVLPFIDELDVERFSDRSILFKISEAYCKEKFIPAFLMSDGTVNIASLIIALYFEYKSIIFIEEPERSIHPYLISKVVDMLKDASSKKQIVATTHNPEIIKYADMSSILLVYRDDGGFARIERPYERETVKMFLKNEIGVEELYVQNLLGV